MQTVYLLYLVMTLIGCNVATGAPHVPEMARCVNVWDEGCINGQLPGAGRDDDFVNGGFNPGKRCVNMWDGRCVDDQFHGAGNTNDLEGYLRSSPRYQFLAKLFKHAQR